MESDATATRGQRAKADAYRSYVRTSRACRFRPSLMTRPPLAIPVIFHTPKSKHRGPDATAGTSGSDSAGGCSGRLHPATAPPRAICARAKGSVLRRAVAGDPCPCPCRGVKRGSEGGSRSLRKKNETTLPQKFPRRDAQRLREFVDGREFRIARAALDVSDLKPVHIRALRKRFLSPAARSP